MKRSIKTYLKRPSKDNTNRSANPSVTRASTILFETMQELKKHELKIKLNKKVTHYLKCPKLSRLWHKNRQRFQTQRDLVEDNIEMPQKFACPALPLQDFRRHPAPAVVRHYSSTRLPPNTAGSSWHLRRRRRSLLQSAKQCSSHLSLHFGYFQQTDGIGTGKRILI